MTYKQWYGQVKNLVVEHELTDLTNYELPPLKAQYDKGLSPESMAYAIGHEGI